MMLERLWVFWFFPRLLPSNPLFGWASGQANFLASYLLDGFQPSEIFGRSTDTGKSPEGRLALSWLLLCQIPQSFVEKNDTPNSRLRTETT